MLGKQLKRLASVANIAVLDMAPGAIMLQTIPEGLIAWYYGIYSAGGVLIESMEQLPGLPLQPEAFRAVAGLFDDAADVTLTPSGSGLKMHSRKRDETLKYVAKPVSPVQETFAPIAATIPTVYVKTAELVAELTLIKGIATKNAAMPILGGVRVLAVNQTIGFQAANGVSMVYQSAIAGEASERFDVVPPVEEFLTALSLFADEAKVGLALVGRSLIIKGERAYAKIQTMAGEFPNVSATFSAIQFTEAVKLPANAIKSLVAATRAYKAPPTITLRPADGGGIVLESEETEIGQSREVVEGTVTRLYNISIDDLDMASRLYDDDLTISFSAEKGMSVVATGQRRLYISCRAL